MHCVSSHQPNVEQVAAHFLLLLLLFVATRGTDPGRNALASTPLSPVCDRTTQFSGHRKSRARGRTLLDGTLFCIVICSDLKNFPRPSTRLYGFFVAVFVVPPILDNTVGSDCWCAKVIPSADSSAVRGERVPEETQQHTEKSCGKNSITGGTYNHTHTSEQQKREK